MAKYMCLRSCQVANITYEKGKVYELASDPGANFEEFTGNRFGTTRPRTYVDKDDGTYFFGPTGWDDLRFPLNGLNPPGLVSDPDIDPDDGLPLFDSASTELIVGLAQLPHSWKEGGQVRPHIHWEPTDGNAGNVLWRLEHKIAAPNGAFPDTWTQLDALDAAAEAVRTHQIAGFAAIKMTGYGLSTIMKFRVSRIGGDASDTYGADAKGLEFDLHYELDSLGSGKEFEK